MSYNPPYALLTSSQNTTDNSSAVTTVACDTTGARLLVVVVGYAAGVAAPAITDNKGNTWTALTRQPASGAASQIFYCAGPTISVGTGHTFTSTRTSSLASILVAAFSGAPFFVPLDKQNGAVVVSATTINPGSVTPVNDNSLIIAADARGVTGSMSIDSGFSIAQQRAYSAGVRWGSSLSYLIQTSLAASNPTITEPASGDSAATIAVFSPLQIVAATYGKTRSTLKTALPLQWGGPFNRLAGGRTPSRGQYYHIAGTTTCEGAFVSRNVYLMRHSPVGLTSGEILDMQTTVDGVGTFDFRYLRAGYYTILSVDPSGAEDDVIHANILAVAM